MDLIDKAKWECEAKRHEKEIRKEREAREALHPTTIDPEAAEGGRDWGISFSD